MGNTISLDRAFKVVKERFGDELAKEGTTDEDIKRYLADLADVDADDYYEKTKLWTGLKMDISRYCAEMHNTVSRDMFQDCVRDYNREGIDDVSECVKTRDELYEKCLEGKKEYDDEIAKVEASMESWDKNTISRYDLDHAVYGLRRFDSKIIEVLKGEID